MVKFMKLKSMRKREIIDYLCGMTIICCWFFADFAGCRLDGRIVIVFVAGAVPLVVLLNSVVILHVGLCSGNGKKESIQANLCTRQFFFSF